MQYCADLNELDAIIARLRGLVAFVDEPRKEASSLHCWPISPYRSWTSISPRFRADRPPRNGSAARDGIVAKPTTG